MQPADSVCPRESTVFSVEFTTLLPGQRTYLTSFTVLFVFFCFFYILCHTDVCAVFSQA